MKRQKSAVINITEASKTRDKGDWWELAEGDRGLFELLYLTDSQIERLQRERAELVARMDAEVWPRIRAAKVKSYESQTSRNRNQ